MKERKREMKHICAMKKYLVDDLSERCEYHIKKDDLDMHDVRHMTDLAEAIKALHEIHAIVHEVEMGRKSEEHVETRPRRQYSYS